MIQSVIHTADIHLRLFKRHEEYTEQFEKFYKECQEIKPDRIVVVGDLVHSKNQMTPELIYMVTNFLNNCSKIAKTVITLGNHDFLANNLDRMDALSPIISTMDNPNIMFLKHTGCYSDASWLHLSPRCLRLHQSEILLQCHHQEECLPRLRILDAVRSVCSPASCWCLLMHCQSQQCCLCPYRSDGTPLCCL